MHYFGLCLAAFFLNILDKVGNIWIPIIFVFLSIMELIFPNLQWKYVQIPIIVLGIISIWNIYNRLVPVSVELQRHRLLYIACQFTFFIYLFHKPTLNIVRKLLIPVLGHTSAGFALNYLVSPWIFAIIFIFVGYFLENSCLAYMPCASEEDNRCYESTSLHSQS